MILRCFSLIALVVIAELSKVRCDDQSASEASVMTESSVSQREYINSTEFTSMASRNVYFEDSTSEHNRIETTTSHSNLPEEYFTFSTDDIENSSQYEEFLMNDSISTFEETTAATSFDLDINAIIEEYSTQKQEEVEDLSRSKPFTTLINLEEEYKMSFDKLANIFIEESKESRLDKKRRRKERNQAVDSMAALQDDLMETEFIKQEVKHKSLGIEPLALMVMPERRTRGPIKATTMTTSWYTQNKKTSFLLTSDVEIDKAPFIVKSKPLKQLELQEDDRSNLTHEAAYLKKSAENTVYLLPPLTVELQPDTALLMNPNERQEIAYEVTNNLNNAARVTFTVRDELGILLEIDRYTAVLGPHASTTVRVAVLPKSGQSSDRITFIATGSEQVRKEVIVDVESNYQSDSDIPDVDYNYLSDCTDIVLSKCKEGSWTIKISAKDTDSGLKILTTIPKGLYIPDGYTAGTKEEVTGIYSQSCCNADLQIFAIDRMNNRYVRQINAYRAPLSFWAVIAISLVSLIFIVIIVVSTLILLKKCKKNEADSFDLPTYRGGRSRY